jgi:Kef-type K+ transport system membrane component KefB/Trk K+ transport system NAD-binding subunit
MHTSAFVELSIVIVIAALVAMVMRRLKQPLILAYILSGIIVGPGVLNLIASNETFDTFSSVGIALLLFIIGLGLNVAVIGKLGRTVFLTAGVLLTMVGGAGTLVAYLFDFTLFQAFIVGLSLFFSSTIIIVKFLSDKKEQNRLHGQIAIGVILIDDIIATLALLFVAAGKGETFGLHTIGELIFHGALLTGGLVIASAWILPRLARSLANSQEMLFLFAIAWGFGIASVFEWAGFSIEIGALFAGVSLASLPYAQEIESRLKPLRDFFVVIFFIVMGASLSIDHMSAVIWPAIALSLIVVILKPLSIISTLGALGYAKRVSFKAGINLSQISEFSIILIALATANGLLPTNATTIVTLVALITIATSSYLIQYDNQLFDIFDRLSFGILNRLFSREVKTREHRQTVKYSYLLFGYHRGGHEFVKTFRRMKKRFLVVDYDPDVIDHLTRQHTPCQYGDATDFELLEEIGARNAKLVVSTIVDFETNQQLIRHLNLFNDEALIVCNANSYEEALQLYELGCSYVMIPHYAGSEHLGRLLEKNGVERKHFDTYRNKHLKELEASNPVDLAEAAL